MKRRALTALIALSLITWSGGSSSIAQAAPGTDAKPIDFEQCANDPPPSLATNCPGGWLNGTLNSNNSHYREDDVVPQRLEAILPAGGPTVGRTLTITYDTRKNGVHGYDSLATWNHTQTTMTDIDRCQGLKAADCVGGAATTAPIPADLTPVCDNSSPPSPCQPTSPVHQLAGQVMTMYGGTIDLVSPPTHNNAATNTMDDTATVIVTYHVSSLLTDRKVQLLFGGHIAASAGPRGWGPNLGAASIPGSAYHISWTMADTSSTGQRDNQIQASALTSNPTITTAPSPGGPVGTTLNDSATIANGNQPGGSITFNLYDPDQSSCTGTPRFTQTVSVSGNGTYSTTGGFAADKVGTWRWTASYSGDFANTAASSGCNAEQVTITKASPSITTTPTPTSGPAGTRLQDSAALSGGYGTLGGTVTFKLYGPSDQTCSGTPAYTEGPISVTSGGGGTGTASTSTGFVANAQGTWHWTATYSGDPNNNGITSVCANEAVAISKADSTTATAIHDAQSNAVVTAEPAGASVYDTATVSGAFGTPTGTVSFTFYTSLDCTTGGSSAGANVALANGSANSQTEGPLNAGSYSFKASYSGDGTYNPSTSDCEPLSVIKATPTISTTATSSTTAGQSFNDVAHLGGGSGPTGPITFTLYSANTNGVCSGPVFSDVQQANGDGDYQSASTSQAPGTYYWIASYGGDTNNNAVSTKCGDSGETSTVIKATPSLTTTATNGTAGGTVQDTAHFSGLVSPTGTGTVTFTLYGPSATPVCSAPIFTSTKPVTANGDVTSDPATVAAAGTYYWIATFTGDANNSGATTSCGDPGETSVVSAPSQSGFMTGGGEVTGSNGQLVTFGGNASGTPGGPDAKGHFNILNHSLKVGYNGDVTAILSVDMSNHEMTFCFTTKTGDQFTVTWRDNGEPGNTSAGTSAANADKLTLRSGCSLAGPILWGVANDPLLRGNVQWHSQGR